MAEAVFPRTIGLGASGVLAFLFVLVAVSSPATAATVTPCPKPPAPAEFDGEAVLVATKATKRSLSALDLKQRLVAPANAFTGRPSFPVSDGNLGDRAATASFSGGIRLSKVGTRRTATISSMRLRLGVGSAAVVEASVSGRRMVVFRLKGAKLRLNGTAGVLNLRAGSARLTEAGSKRLRSRLGIAATKALRPGSEWGSFSAFVSRNDQVENPEGETPAEPPLLARPEGAADIVSASIKWRVRESFIRYVAVGDGTSVANGATADPPEQIGGAAPLVYSFNFPFARGWALPGGDTAIYGSGTVGFRYCSNTINFTVSDPEVELVRGGVSRLIFRVNGTDGTAFPNSRAVMVDLVPDLNSPTVQGNTTTYTDIPAYVPQESTGIFADFYPPYPGDPGAPGAELSRFGSLTVSFTTG